MNFMAIKGHIEVLSLFVRSLIAKGGGREGNVWGPRSVSFSGRVVILSLWQIYWSLFAVTEGLKPKVR